MGGGCLLFFWPKGRRSHSAREIDSVHDLMRSKQAKDQTEVVSRPLRYFTLRKRKAQTLTSCTYATLGCWWRPMANGHWEDNGVRESDLQYCLWWWTKSGRQDIAIGLLGALLMCPVELGGCWCESRGSIYLGNPTNSSTASSAQALASESMIACSRAISTWFQRYVERAYHFWRD